MQQSTQASPNPQTSCAAYSLPLIPLVLSGLLVLAMATWLRFPFIGAGLPYFYDEDEGHHFNRVVNMVKEGAYNPKYFLKPSLHFYVRMPVTAAAFLHGVKEGDLRSLKDIRTRDTFGLSDYSFSASHPKIAKYNRAFSVLCGLISIALVGAIALSAGLGLTPTIGAVLLTATSPALVSSSAVIGVDVLVAPLVLAAVLCSLLAYNASLAGRATGRLLLLAAVFAGLATSTKYNAALVVFVPMITALLSGPYSGRWRAMVWTALVAAGAFLMGTPFLIVELPLFLDHVAYEIWHYGIAGHVGNEGQPGWGQVVHYTRWLASEGVGVPALIILGAGTAVSALRLHRIPRKSLVSIVIVGAFGVLYFAFMCSQKANFVRNMLVLIPFIALGVAAATAAICNLLPRDLLARYGKHAQPLLLSILLLVPLVTKTLPQRAAVEEIEESRLVLADWMHSPEGVIFAKKRIGIAGELQIQRNTLPGGFNITRYPAAEVATWAPNHTDVAILPSGQSFALAGWARLATLDGAPLPMRIVRNPALTIWIRASADTTSEPEVAGEGEDKSELEGD